MTNRHHPPARRFIASLAVISLSFLPVVARQTDDAARTRDKAAVTEAMQSWWPASMNGHNQRIAWWREARFGCFIHWGVYSAFGGEWKGAPFRGYAEHMMRIQRIPLAEYKEKVVVPFNPVKFDAEEWVGIIKAAGMKYVVITAKHHDGFAMYPSSVTGYNLRDATAFKRDPMRELADACRRNGLRFGFYYSHAFDWQHPDAPGNDWDYDNPGGDRQLHGGVEWYDQNPELLAKARRYVDEKAIPQILELLKVYKPDILWFDTPGKLPLSENLRILKELRGASTSVVVNGRLARGQGHSFGDYKNTSDRAAEFYPTDGDWESIPTTNESYGYHRHDLSHKPVSHFIQLLAKAAARGGNILMNIGPMGDGRIDEKDQQILAGIGKWLEVNGAGVYSTERTPLPVQPWGESTRKGNTLYLHVFEWPRSERLIVGGVKGPIARAYLLADNKRRPLKTTRLNESDILISIPARAPDPANSVVVIEAKGEPRTNPVRLLAGAEHDNVLRVFDGELHGRRLRFGDGKAPRAYVYDWNDPNESVGWRVRLNAPAVFTVAIKYSIETPGSGGAYSVAISDQVLRAKVAPTPGNAVAATAELGQITVAAGEHEVRIKPLEIQGGELMRLFALSLTPVEPKKP